MLDFSQGITVQEIASHTMQPIVLDGVLTNYSSLVSPMKMSASKIGPLTHGGGQMKASKPDGVNLLAGVVCEQLAFADVGYASHLTYRNAAYGAQKYTSLTADDGTDLSGYYVGSPFTLSRSITVRSVNNGDGTYTSSATFRHQLDRPYNRAVSVAFTYHTA